MSKGVAVTGMGIISAIGNHTQANLQALRDAKPGIFPPSYLETRHHHLPVGEIKISDEALVEKLGLPDNHACTRAALLGIIAVKEAIKQAGIKPGADTAFISSTCVGGIDKTAKYFDDFSKNENLRRFIRAQHPGFTTEKIAEYFHLTGFVTTVSTACSSGANAVMLGARMIRAGKCKRVIVGGSDCLTQFTLNGFNSLMIHSDEVCQPFDEDRKGLNLGEAAAYLVLEAEEVLQGKKVLGQVVGYGNANDAFHQTASSERGEGAYLAMKQALKLAGISAGEIDYINAHGTATQNNDLSESVAFQRIFKESLPFFSSTKAFTGHSLAAAGAVEAVYSLLSLQEKLIFPNLNFENPLKDTGLVLVTETTAKKLQYVLSNSFGFGGNCTSLIFSKDER